VFQPVTDGNGANSLPVINVKLVYLSQREWVPRRVPSQPPGKLGG
jgi:hypothetical protein